MKKVVIHTDGACSGNPGPGGWAAMLEFGKHKRELSGGVPATTNNRMELQAAIEALNALKEPCVVEIHTDSEYLKNGVQSWMINWKRNGWMTKARKPVKNVDLWQQLDQAITRHQIDWHWVKGHAGQEGNERCDELATEAVAKIRASTKPNDLKAALKEFTAVGKSAEPGLGLA